MSGVAARVLAQVNENSQEDEVIRRSLERVLTSHVITNTPGIVQFDLQNETVRCYDLGHESAGDAFENLKRGLGGAENPFSFQIGVDEEQNIGWHYRKRITGKRAPY